MEQLTCMALSKNLVYRYLNYMHTLERLAQQGIHTVSSYNLAALCDVTASQLRKDLMNFPAAGKQRVGYPVRQLLETIKSEIQRDSSEPVIVIGAGSFGTALLKYKAFSRFGFNLIAGFDIDTSPRKDVDVPILPMDRLDDFVRQHKVRVAILTVPPDAAQSVAHQLADSSVEKILNLTSVVLSLPDNVTVNNINLVFELEYLMFDSLPTIKEDLA